MNHLERRGPGGSIISNVQYPVKQQRKIVCKWAAKKRREGRTGSGIPVRPCQAGRKLGGNYRTGDSTQSQVRSVLVLAAHTLCMWRVARMASRQQEPREVVLSIGLLANAWGLSIPSGRLSVSRSMHGI